MSLDQYKTALVSGASSGIGAATVRQLTARGIKVHAVARRADRLDALAAETGCEVLAMDLRDHAQVYRAFADMNTDILVNNAGVGRGFTGFLDATPDDIETTLGTNVQAATHLLRAVVPGMVERGRGHIVNLGSVAGLYPINSAIYGGSKGAMHLISQNLRMELLGKGIRVTEVCPGRVATEFFNAATDDQALAERVVDTGIEVLESEDVASAIMFALEAPARANISTIELTPTNQVFGGGAFARD